MYYPFLFCGIDEKTKEPYVFAFEKPVEKVVCSSPVKIYDCFQILENAIKNGFFIAGFFSYELGYYFLEIPCDPPGNFPLFSFGICNPPRKMSLENLFEALPSGSFSISNQRYSASEEEYASSFLRVKDHLAKGNTYQVNYTFKCKFDFLGAPAGLFSALLKTQPVPYASFMDMDNWSLLSLSPELFFRRKGHSFLVRPMKGTFKRNKDKEKDNLNRIALESSVKNRAENIMIVDLLRNDLGTISSTGSVVADSLFTVEKYKTLFQMTSTVKSILRKNIPWHDIFSNIFPSGSVTGAPKKSTMKIIKEVEKEPRNIYTGSMGYIAPDNSAQFNVAIRTLLINNRTGKGEMGLGSGLVYDSSREDEYKECLLKGMFFTGLEDTSSFSLIETILWENGSFFLLEQHLERIRKSASFFSFAFKEDKIRASLHASSKNFVLNTKYKVRLTSGKSGDFSVSCSLLDTVSFAKKNYITVSPTKTDKADIFLFHKTTKRDLYEKEFANAKRNGLFDIVFFNQHEELTEGAITNILLKKDDIYYTPPVSSGLLNGIYRQFLLSSGRLVIKEKVLFKEDLENADNIFLVNSVRKLVPVELKNRANTL